MKIYALKVERCRLFQWKSAFRFAFIVFALHKFLLWLQIWQYVNKHHVISF